MNDFEFKAYAELYEQLRNGNDNQIAIIRKEIRRLQSLIDKRNERDIIEEIYNQHDIADKNISLHDFRIGVYTSKHRKSV